MFTLTRLETVGPLHCPGTGLVPILMAVSVGLLFCQPRCKRECLAMSCESGIEVNSSRSRFWNQLEQAGKPVLMDLFSTNGEVHAVFNTKPALCHHCFGKQWNALQWKFSFLEGVEYALPPPIDPHQHTLIVSCKIIISAYAARHVSLPVHLSIQATESTSNHTFEYTNLTFCRYPVQAGPVPNFKYLLGACTSVLGDHLFRVPEWIVYHLQQGWEHFYVYVNEDPSAAHTLLAPFISKGYVDVIDFHFPPINNFTHQQSAENSCLTRYRGVARWVSMSDVDEFFQPHSLTVADFLTSHSHLHNIGGFQFRQYRFGSPQNDLVQNKGVATVSKNTEFVVCISEFIFRDELADTGLFKTIVQPSQVVYFSVHMVTLGLVLQNIDHNHVMRMAHYKTPRSTRYVFQDISMARHANAVKRQLTLLGFVNYTIPETAWFASWICC